MIIEGVKKRFKVIAFDVDREGGALRVVGVHMVISCARVAGGKLTRAFAERKRITVCVDKKDIPKSAYWPKAFGEQIKCECYIKAWNITASNRALKRLEIHDELTLTSFGKVVTA